MAHYRVAKPTRRRRLCELTTRAWLATSTDTRAVGFAARIEGATARRQRHFVTSSVERSSLGQSGRASRPSVYYAVMEGTRSPGQGTAIEGVGIGVGAAKASEASPGKRTLTMGLDASLAQGAADTGVAAIAQMGPGRPLDGAAANAAAAVLGQPPGDVQVHVGPEAEQFVAQHQARAVTIGNHIAFGAGQYRPGTSDGDMLIAHEIAHVIQMRGADPAGPVGHGAQGAEAEADHAADTIVAAQHGVPDVGGPGRDKATVSPQPLALHKDDTTSGSKPDPVKKAALELADKVGQEVADSTRDKVRNRLYAQYSAPNKTLARDRRAKKAPDLTGLGAVVQIDELVTRFRSFLPFWSDKDLDADKRALAMYQLAQAMLVIGGVPQFEGYALEDMKPKGAFSSGDWRFHFQRNMMANNAPSQDDHADLVNALAHESRHAEQAWAAARVAAGKGMKPDDIADAVGILPKIAGLARKQPITAKTASAAELAFASAMFDAEVTNKATNLNLEAVVAAASKDLVARNDACAKAVGKLRGNPTSAEMAATVKARDALRAAVTAYSDAYRDYRQIPFEADAHEVGDAAATALLENP
jgi:hypothetical protein